MYDVVVTENERWLNAKWNGLLFQPKLIEEEVVSTRLPNKGVERGRPQTPRSMELVSLDNPMHATHRRSTSTTETAARARARPPYELNAEAEAASTSLTSLPPEVTAADEAGLGTGTKTATARPLGSYVRVLGGTGVCSCFIMLLLGTFFAALSTLHIEPCSLVEVSRMEEGRASRWSDCVAGRTSTKDEMSALAGGKREPPWLWGRLLRLTIQFQRR